MKLHRSLDVPEGAESVKGAGASDSCSGCQGCGEAAGNIPVLRWVLLVVARANFLSSSIFSSPLRSPSPGKISSVF